MRTLALIPLVALVSCATSPAPSHFRSCTVSTTCFSGDCAPSTTRFDITLSDDRATAALLVTATQDTIDAIKMDAGPITLTRQTSDVQIGTLSYTVGHNNETLLDIDEQTLTRAAITEFWSHGVRTLTATCTDRGQAR